MNTASSTAAELPTRTLPAAPTAPARARPRPRHPRQVAIERLLGRLFARAEVGVAVLGVFLFSGAVVPLLLSQGSASVFSSVEGNPVLRATYLPIAALGIVLTAVHWRATLAAAGRNRATALLVAMVLLSVLWSAVPDVTLRRAVSFLGTTAFGCFLAVRFDTRGLLRVLAVALGAAILGSWVFGIALPDLGRHGPGLNLGAWRGVFPQKNLLGATMVLAFLVYLVLARTMTRNRWLAWSGMALSFGLILASRSKTALGVTLVLLALVWVFRTLRWRASLVVPTLAGVVVVGGAVGAWLVAHMNDILVSMDKDPTFTGRTPMWEGVLEMIGERPLLGYGYGAFWLGWEGPSARILRVIQWNSPHAHNGFLDLALQLGLLGTLVFFVGYGIAVARGLRTVRRAPGFLGVWPLVFLTYLFLYNFTETTLLQQNNLFWALYVAVVAGWRPDGETGGDAARP